MTQRTDLSEGFRQAAEVEANTPITAGAATAGPAGYSTERGGTAWLALAKLVELRRRQQRLSAEQLATEADVELEDIVRIERGEGSFAEPRTLQQIARVLRLPEQRILELAGLVRASDGRIRQASVRFAARSEPTEDLLPEELQALEEYVKVLTEA